MNRKNNFNEISNVDEDNIEKTSITTPKIITREWKLKIYQMTD